MNTYLSTHVHRQLLVTAASAYVALKLVYGELKPIALEVWGFFTSEQAKRVYEFCILSAIALVWMSAYAAVWLGNQSRTWVDGFVDSHLEQPAPIAETPVETLVEVAPSEAVMVDELKTLLQTKLKAIEESEAMEALEALIALGEATAAAKEGITIDVTVTEPVTKKRRKSSTKTRRAA